MGKAYIDSHGCRHDDGRSEDGRYAMHGGPMANEWNQRRIVLHNARAARRVGGVEGVGVVERAGEL